MKRSPLFLLLGVLFLLPSCFVCERAFADSAWTGQPPAPPVTGTLGPYSGLGAFQTQDYVMACGPAHLPPPCTAGLTPTYVASGNFTDLSAIPSGAGQNTNLGVFVSGAYANPSSPTGLSGFSGAVSLDSFATSSSVGALSSSVDGLKSSLATLGTSFQSLSNSVGTLSDSVKTLSAQMKVFTNQLRLQDRDAREGIATSIAMDGAGQLASDEKFALSFNMGTYGGQSGVGGGFALRVADHVAFNGSIGTGTNGGLVGARAGFRIAW